LQEYADGRPTEVDDAGLTKQIGRSDIPVVIDFWATWCGPFRTMAPAFAQIASTLEPNVRFLKIDVDANPGWAAKLGVRGIPALFVFIVAEWWRNAPAPQMALPSMNG
jgi:thioredoxin 2